MGGILGGRAGIQWNQRPASMGRAAYRKIARGEAMSVKAEFYLRTEAFLTGIAKPRNIFDMARCVGAGVVQAYYVDAIAARILSPTIWAAIALQTN
jgi:hypothetical protein